MDNYGALNNIRGHPWASVGIGDVREAGVQRHSGECRE